VWLLQATETIKTLKKMNEELSGELQQLQQRRVVLQSRLREFCRLSSAVVYFRQHGMKQSLETVLCLHVQLYNLWFS